MSRNSGFTIHKAASRISQREDNLYSTRVINTVLKMYMEECKQELLKGKSVQLTGIGTIIPEVKTCKHFNLPSCNKEDGNLPYTKVKMKRNDSLIQEMNTVLRKNIENGILGLENLPFERQQIAILKNNGLIPDEETESKEDGVYTEE